MLWNTYFDIHTIAFTIESLKYPVSYLELTGVVTGFLVVGLATQINPLSWWIGFINIAAYSFLFYQLQLYADMVLQVYYLGVALYGLWHWNQAQNTLEVAPKKLDLKGYEIVVLLFLLLWEVAHFTFQHIHIWFPNLFPKPTAYVVAETLILSLSLIANWLLAKKYIDNWLLWIMVNAVASTIYYYKEIYFTSFQYLIFLILAIYGYLKWYYKTGHLSHFSNKS